MPNPRLFDYKGSDKHKQRIAELLNVTDVIKDGVSMVDNDGIVDLSLLTVLQDEIDAILRYLDIDIFYRDENDNIYTDENGNRYTTA